jgi:arylsulfatase A
VSVSCLAANSRRATSFQSIQIWIDGMLSHRLSSFVSLLIVSGRRSFGLNCLAVVLASALNSCPLLAAPRVTPNVIVIQADDLGWGDIGAMAGRIPTPNLDRLLNEGMSFTDAHTPAATCHPSRFAMVTGSNVYRTGVRYGFSLPANNALTYGGQRWTTMGDVVKNVRDTSGASIYSTSFIGKMHLGLPSLSEHGYDHAYALPTGIQGQSNMIVDENAQLIVDDLGTPLSDGIFELNAENVAPIGAALAGAAKRFIESNAHRPFLLNYNSQAVHSPQFPPETFEAYDGSIDEVKGSLDKNGQPLSRYAAMVKEFDLQVGLILDTLDAEGIAKDTLVILTSDNGAGFSIPGIQPSMPEGHYSTGYISTTDGSLHRLRGSKGTMWEGGTRVPFVARWGDGTIEGSYVEPGSVNHQLVSTMDIMTSLYDLTGQAMESDQAMDGVSFLPTLFAPDRPVRDELYMQGAANPNYVDFDGLVTGWRMDDSDGKWVLLFQTDDPEGIRRSIPERLRATELYNLADDLSQSDDLLDVAIQIDEDERPVSSDLEAISDIATRDRVAKMIEAYFDHWMKGDQRTTSVVDYSLPENQTAIPQLRQLYGDANLDGVVDLTDLNIVRNNFGNFGIGDVNYDGVVNLNDLNVVRNNFGATQSESVPEPSAVALSAISVLMALVFARRVVSQPRLHAGTTATR